MNITIQDGIEYWVNDRGVILISKNAALLKDEVLGKLLKTAYDIYPVADVADVDATSLGDGGLKVTFSVYLNADEIAALPSIYDEKPTKRGKK